MTAEFEAVPVTEQGNPRTTNLSSLPVAEIVRLMNEEGPAGFFISEPVHPDA